MTNRRQFMQSAVICTGANFFPLLAKGNGQPLAIDYFVFDERYAQAQAMAATADPGIKLAPLAGDPMPFWYDTLDLQWREKPMLLSGLTTAKTLFVFETLANDRGMRVIHRSVELTENKSLDDSELVLWVIAPTGTQTIG